MKILIPVFIIGILVFSGIGVSAYTNIDELNSLQINRDSQSVLMINRDELDQYQLEMEEYYIHIGSDPDITYDFLTVAQEFKPTKRALTRVELLVCRGVYATYPLTVAIKDDLRGPDLTSISINSESIPTDDFTWIEFDFDDIDVTPGFSYYIVCTTVEEPNNRYKWGLTIYDLYQNGSISWSLDGQEWYFDSGIDTAFKTYGFNNLPPAAPTIDGPTNGKVGGTYDYEFTVCVDPDGDDMTYHVEWGDGGTDEGFVASGGGFTLSHIWTEKGKYTIKAKLIDEYGAESEWATFDVSIPRTKSLLNHPLQDFFSRFTNLFPILRLILI